MHQPACLISYQCLSFAHVIIWLKQSLQAWYDQLKSTLCTWGFKRSVMDVSLFTMKIYRDVFWAFVYVDDIVITCSNFKHIDDRFIQRLHFELSLKDLGQLSYFLGIKVSEETSRLHLTQTKYIHDLLIKLICWIVSRLQRLSSPLSV